LSTPTEKPKSESRRNFIKYGVAAVAGAAVASAIEIPILDNTIGQKDNTISQQASQISNLNSQISSLQSDVIGSEGIITLSVNEVKEVEAIVETIIPSDSQTGPGAKEAGVIYFIDKQLAGDYGKGANMYMKGPFVPSGQKGPITVGGITYPQGSPTYSFSGPTYQYSINLREFWRYGLAALEDYSSSVFGNKFENLTTDQKTQALTDLFNNKPTSFNNIVPKDFFNEVIFMTWSGFLMDPAYGGNRQMIGWQLVGFNGLNMGNFYSEGYSPTQIMVLNKPVRLKPASLGQYQKNLGVGGP
jgi:gluconate 2-dehydrogenase gamma chain